MDPEPKKILVVEDEAPLLQVLMDRLNSEGFKVIGAKDGEEGLALALKELPSLILLDIVMPKMNGLELLKKLRANSLGENIPVILLTNLGDTANILEAKEFGVLDYLIKSNLILEDMVKLIKEKLNITASFTA